MLTFIFVIQERQFLYHHVMKLQALITFLIIFIVAGLSPGCESSKRAYSEKRGLMLLENTQLGKNKGYYSKHHRKKVSKGYRKIHKKRKFVEKPVPWSPSI
jgi:hypothetical protein